MRSVILLACLLALVGACGSTDPAPDAARPAAGAAEAAAPADSWVTIDGVQFPDAMADAPPEVIESYVFAAKHPEVLSRMPCYCGCEHPRFGHRSNYDCFVDAIDRSGPLPRVDVDPMGFG